MSAPTPLAGVRVAASTSNLGPGFDCLGLALGLFLEVRVFGAGTDANAYLEREGEARTWPERDDLFLAAFDAARRAGGGGPAGAFAVRSEIPVGRGFGSTGSAVAAGLLLGASVSATPPGRDELHALGVELEGHPDNVTASLFGGLTVCHPTAAAGRPLMRRDEVAPELRFVLAWSAESSPTHEARRLLPASVPFADAVENPRRLALLLAGLRTGRREWIAAGILDRLHVPYRLPSIAGGAAALDAALEAGAWAATISGAGSGLVAITDAGSAEGVAAAMRSALGEKAPGANARVVRQVTEAPRARTDGPRKEAQDGA